jgi:hypothetical protein
MLIKSALRFGSAMASRDKIDKPIEALTTFKPFNIMELDCEVYETKQAKMDHYLRDLEERGMKSSTPTGGARRNTVHTNKGFGGAPQPMGAAGFG